MKQMKKGEFVYLKIRAKDKNGHHSDWSKTKAIKMWEISRKKINGIKTVHVQIDKDKKFKCKAEEKDALHSVQAVVGLQNYAFFTYVDGKLWVSGHEITKWLNGCDYFC